MMCRGLRTVLSGMMRRGDKTCLLERCRFFFFFFHTKFFPLSQSHKPLVVGLDTAWSMPRQTDRRAENLSLESKNLTLPMHLSLTPFVSVVRPSFFQPIHPTPFPSNVLETPLYHA